MSEPVILELEVTAPIVLQAVQNGIAQGKSAYQSYVDTTDDDPVMTETQWAERTGISEYDPLFTQWITDTPPAYPSDLHDQETAASIGNLHLTTLHVTRGYVIYHDQSRTADTIGDWRQYADGNGFYTQYCTLGNATKGAGTWVTKFTIQI